MKLEKTSIIGIAAALLLIIGVVGVFITTSHNKTENNNRLEAVPVQNSSSIDLTGMFRNAKRISEARDLIESITEGSMDTKKHISVSPSDQSKGYYYRSFVIKFKQDMDASTLNSQNILAFVDKNSTQLNCNYDANSRELQIDIKLDNKKSSGTGNTATIYVLVTKNIKEANGKSIDNDYVSALALNQ